MKLIAKLSAIVFGLSSLQAMAAGQDLQQLQQSVKKAAETKVGENVTTKVAGKTLSLTEAVKIALSSSPTILTQKLATDSAAAAVRMEKGAFDPTAYTAVNTGRVSAPVTTYDRQIYEGLAFLSRGEATWVAGISKNTRYGISGDFSVMVYRKDPINYDRDYITTSNHSIVNFKLNIPLLQGRGTTSAAAGEQSAQLNYEAGTLELRHAIAVTVYQAVAAYWDYKTAVEALKVTQASEARVKGWLDSTEAYLKRTGKLEEIEQQNQGSIKSLIAYEADRKSATIAAREQVKQAQDNLALALGILFDQFAKIGLPGDEFPKNVADKQINDLNLVTRWSAVALDSRLDLQAAKLRQQAAQVLLAKARRDVLPKLDLQLSVGSQGLSEGADFDRFPKSITEQIYGLNTSVGLNFMYPIGNNTARGMLDQAQANYQQAVIQTNELARNIKSQINLNIAALQRRISEANMTEKAVKFYQPSLDNLRKQAESSMIAQSSGKSSSAPATSNLEILMGLTDLEDKLNSATNQHLMAQAELAKTIAATRLNTGVLISLQHDENQININELTTLPQ